MIKATIEKLDTYDSIYQPNRYRRTCIETSEGNRYCDIPVDDVIKIAEIYERTPHDRLDFTPERFALTFGSRLFSEWCMEDELKRKTEPDYKPKDHYSDYKGQDFSDFATQETHFELIRRGYQWDEETKQFRSLNAEQYQQVRERILGGLVLKAIDLFSEWNGNEDPPHRIVGVDKKIKYIYDDTRNLRCDLRDYIKRPDELTSHSIQNVV